MAGRDARRLGTAGERRALDFLCHQGLVELQRNYHCRAGELDLVMLDRQILVFVEVRQRRDGGLTTAAESVDRHKQKKLAAAALSFLSRQPQLASRTMRFDVVALNSRSSGDFTIEWIKDAFRPDA